MHIGSNYILRNFNQRRSSRNASAKVIERLRRAFLIFFIRGRSELQTVIRPYRTFSPFSRQLKISNKPTKTLWPPQKYASCFFLFFCYSRKNEWRNNNPINFAGLLQLNSKFYPYNCYHCIWLIALKDCLWLILSVHRVFHFPVYNSGQNGLGQHQICCRYILYYVRPASKHREISSNIDTSPVLLINVCWTTSLSLFFVARKKSALLYRQFIAAEKPWKIILRGSGNQN